MDHPNMEKETHLNMWLVGLGLAPSRMTSDVQTEKKNKNSDPSIFTQIPVAEKLSDPVLA